MFKLHFTATTNGAGHWAVITTYVIHNSAPPAPAYRNAVAGVRWHSQLAPTPPAGVGPLARWVRVYKGGGMARGNTPNT